MKRLAVLSDIHGNSWALEAVLADIEKQHVDGCVNLGDSLYGPLDPGGTASLLEQMPMVTVNGNQDRMILESCHQECANPTLAFVLSELTSRQVAWLGQFGFVLQTGDGLFLCHGTPNQDDEYLVETVDTGFPVLRDDSVLLKKLQSVDEPIVLCGHSHIQQWVQLSNSQIILNPGSVGLPAYDDDLPVYHRMQSGSPYAAYAILTIGDAFPSVRFVRVLYNWQKAADVARQHEREDWAAWLATGRV